MNCPLLKYNRGTGTFRKKTQNNPKSQNTRVVKGHRCTYPCVFTHTIYPIEGRVLRSEIGVIEFWVLFFITPGWKRKDRIFQRGHKGSRKLVSVTSRRYKMLQRSVIKPTFPIRSFHKKRTSVFVVSARLFLCSKLCFSTRTTIGVVSRFAANHTDCCTSNSASKRSEHTPRMHIKKYGFQEFLNFAICTTSALKGLRARFCRMVPGSADICTMS